MQSQGSMEDPMVVDADESKKMNNNLDHENSATKSLKKRKRASSSSSSLVQTLTTEDKEARVNALRIEMEGLFRYYKEVSDDKINLDLNECGSSNSAMMYLLEETTLSLSKLVDQIYEKMRTRKWLCFWVFHHYCFCKEHCAFHWLQIFVWSP
ncbi:Chromatin assembly factor 1 subunit FAS1 [Camellia lanceoleosa]|uniref:Chromatin assembly factor 1 subunit FAS1 n=1 Tax=Camellia lanceoleosa TaxID=1840588 RepID=A0ACC0J4E7_9ERIC|nr:Chromatin assembly factor 1 subunit FAS1 [Camellia lanceoleosa]